MHFRTDPAWEETNPVFKIFDDPKRPLRRWKAVELPYASYYYLVHIPLETEEETMLTDILFADFYDALHTLKDYDGSNLHIQVPEWDNDGELALYQVNKIYKTVESKIHIAECSNGKTYILSIGTEQEDLDFEKVAKEVVWSHPD